MPDDIKDSYADISLAKKVLGYRPKVSLADGLNEIIESKKNDEWTFPFLFLLGALTNTGSFAIRAVRTQHPIFNKCRLCDSFVTYATFHNLITPRSMSGQALILLDIG